MISNISYLIEGIPWGLSILFFVHFNVWGWPRLIFFFSFDLSLTSVKSVTDWPVFSPNIRRPNFYLECNSLFSVKPETIVLFWVTGDTLEEIHLLLLGNDLYNGNVMTCLGPVTYIWFQMLLWLCLGTIVPTTPFRPRYFKI